jgi:PHD-finger/PHD-zinc-finger like domain
LPGAQYLSQLSRSPCGSVPRREAIPTEEAHARARACAAAWRLPPAVRGIPAEDAQSGRCHVCDRDDESDGVQLLGCVACGVHVHTTCYDTAAPPAGGHWRCDVCTAGIAEPPICALCPVIGGALKLAGDGRWVHATCALWIRGIEMLPGQLPDLSRVRRLSTFR